jgi:hypothetical protein
MGEFATADHRSIVKTEGASAPALAKPGHLNSIKPCHLNSMILAIGPITFINSRQCHFYLQHYSLQFNVAISDGLRDELTYWSHLSLTHFRERIWPSPFTSDISNGVMLEQQFWVRQWRIEICRHKVSFPSSCGTAHPIAH